MEVKKLAVYIVFILSIAAVLSQTPQFQAIGMGQHTFVSGRNVNCIACHNYDAYQDMNSSQLYVLEAHKRAASNNNYTTYLEVGGIDYDPAGIIITSVDSDNSGTNDTWTWNGTMWIYNNTAKLYDLDFNGDESISGAEMCKLCHNLELMGESGPVSEVHTVGTRYCDDDRCHGNSINQYNSYLLFKKGGFNLTASGFIISNNSVHGDFYTEAAVIDSNDTNYFHSYRQVPGNALPGHTSNVSASPFTCLGCHSYINVVGSVEPDPQFNHSDSNASKKRYN